MDIQILLAIPPCWVRHERSDQRERVRLLDANRTPHNIVYYGAQDEIEWLNTIAIRHSALPRLKRFEYLGRCDLQSHHRGTIEPFWIEILHPKDPAQYPFPRIDDPVRSSVGRPPATIRGEKETESVRFRGDNLNIAGIIRE